MQASARSSEVTDVRLDWKHRFALLAIPFVMAACSAAIAAESLVGQPLDAAIRSFEQQGYRLFYSSDLVRPWMRVETSPSAPEPIAALDEILAPHGLKLRRGLNDSWLIVRSPRPRVTVQESPDPPRDAVERTTPTTLPVEEIIVAASRYEIRRAQTAPQWQISDFDLDNLPNMGNDTVRATARLPGMASNGWSALSNVRGGEITETLVRLDGLRLYHPFHLKDFQNVFSAIDPRIVESMDVYTGGFPASYGDRLSGVIDVETIRAPSEPYHELGFSFFNSSFLSAGSFADSRAAWTASVRRSNLDILYDRFSQQPDRPRYTDAFARLSFDVNDQLGVTANVLRVEDDISLSDDIDREERARATQLDTYAWIRLDHRINGVTGGSTVVAHSSFSSARQGTSSKSGISSGSLTDRRSFTLDSVQTEWSRVVGARMLFEFGGAFTQADGSYRYQDDVEYDLRFDFDGAPDAATRSRSIAVWPETRELSVFTNVRFDWSSDLTTEFGMRWHRQELTDRDDTTLAPRLGLRYSLSPVLAFRASWGRFYQSQTIHELQVSDGITEFFAPQKADQVIIGFDRLLAEGIELRVEAYEKSMSHLRPRFENLLNTRVLLPELKPDRIRIAPGSASARGIEVAVDGESGKLSWWAALSAARVRDRIDGIDVPRSWDQTYALNGGSSWDTSKWNLSAGLTYRSGWPTTPVTFDEEAATPTVTLSSRNSARMDPFASLDARVTRRFMLDGSQLNVSFEVANLSDRSNPCCFEYEIGDEEDAGEFKLDELTYLGRIPSFGILWQF